MNILSYVPYGTDGIIIRVEADIRRGIPGVDITGLAEGAVKEARERVRAGFRNSGYVFPPDRVLINLSPAGVRKAGAALDLPIALAVMAAAGRVPPGEDVMVLGEMELSGAIRPVRGVLAAAAAGLKAGVRDFIVPEGNAAEALILAEGAEDTGDKGGGGFGLAAVASLNEAVEALTARAASGRLPPASSLIGRVSGGGPPLEARQGPAAFDEVLGQDTYKRALEIAAAGGHNLLVFGPPGAGKTMLARRLLSITPPLTLEEAVEVTRIHSLAGQLSSVETAGDGGGGGAAVGGAAVGGGLIRYPPFRSPHHSASAEGVLGGGRTVRPGEISLAHLGFLFLDEAPEFRSPVLQALREPLEDRVVTIVRAEGPVKLPADFQLILAANGCPCGRLGIKPREGGKGGRNEQPCFCGADEIQRYWRKFGGALLDRVELRVPVSNPGLRLQRTRTGEDAGKDKSDGEAIARRVALAVDIQRERFRGGAVRRNARMTPSLMEKHCALSPKAKGALEAVVSKLGFSGRAYHGCLRVARTIADLEGSPGIAPVHILEAAHHRRYGDDPYDIFRG